MHSTARNARINDLLAVASSPRRPVPRPHGWAHSALAQTQVAVRDQRHHRRNLRRLRACLLRCGERLRPRLGRDPRRSGRRTSPDLDSDDIARARADSDEVRVCASLTSAVRCSRCTGPARRVPDLAAATQNNATNTDFDQPGSGSRRLHRTSRSNSRPTKSAASTSGVSTTPTPTAPPWTTNCAPPADTCKKQGIALVLENEQECNTCNRARSRAPARPPCLNLGLNWDPANAVWARRTRRLPCRLGHAAQGPHPPLPLQEHGSQRRRQSLAWSPVDIGLIDWTAQFRALKAIGYSQRGFAGDALARRRHARGFQPRQLGRDEEGAGSCRHAYGAAVLPGQSTPFVGFTASSQVRLAIAPWRRLCAPSRPGMSFVTTATRDRRPIFEISRVRGPVHRYVAPLPQAGPLQTARLRGDAGPCPSCCLTPQSITLDAGGRVDQERVRLSPRH